MEFYSGESGQPGRISEGVWLRRIQPPTREYSKPTIKENSTHTDRSACFRVR
jgi:hypothetical protein